MNDLMPMSFEEYEQSIGTVSVQKNPATKNNEDYVGILSPFSSGNYAEISSSARKRILDYAHPADSSLIKALDNPTVNAAMSKLVQAGIDANYGIALATGIRVTNRTSPEIYDIVKECSEKLEIAFPYVIISDSIKGLNACTCGTNQFAFIMISSLLPMIMSRDELCFIIGHECGHLAMGHALYHTAGQLIGQAGSLLPVVGDIIANTIKFPLNAWERRSEITADRAGLICCGDIDIAKKALFRLEAGFYNISGINIDEYVRESEKMLSGSHLGRVSEYVYSHPLIPKRIKALEVFSKSEVYAEAMGMEKNDRMIKRSVLNSEIEHIIEVLENPLTN